MTRSIPPFIPKSIIGAPITHNWTERDTLKYYVLHDDIYPTKIHDAIDRIAYRAKYVLGLSIAEWIVWRFDGMADTGDLHQRLEAARPSVINWRYTKNLQVDLDDTPELSSDLKINEPLRLALTFLGELQRYYTIGYIYMTGMIVKMTVLAGHVLPTEAKTDFENWFKESIRRAARVYPPQPPYDKNTEQYIYTAEESVPMELYDLQQNFTREQTTDTLRALVKSLDPKTNPYLNSPDEMKALGFRSTPYEV